MDRRNRSQKISKYPTGNRTPNLPSCGAVPKPTAPTLALNDHCSQYRWTDTLIYTATCDKRCQIQYEITDRNLKKLMSINQTDQQETNKISCYMLRHYKFAFISIHCGSSDVFETVRCKQHRHTMAHVQKLQSKQMRRTPQNFRIL